jgi:stage III sporulation protein AB
MKNILTVAIFILSVLFWQTKRIRLFRRVDSLKRIKAFVINVGDEIRSSKRNVFDIIGADKTGLGLFKNVSVNGELLYVYYLKAKEKNLGAMCLDSGEEMVLDRFFCELGRGDVTSQIRLCEESISAVDGYLCDAIDRSKKYGKLYTVAGFSMGTFAVIMLL